MTIPLTLRQVKGSPLEWSEVDGNFTALRTGIEAAAVSSSAGGFRNKIINGKMEIAQRGASVSVNLASGNTYLLDRFFANITTSTAVLTASQEADWPNPVANEFQRSFRAAVTTADAAIAAGGTSLLGQNLEGFNVRDLIGRAFTLSFWVRSSKTGTHCVSFVNSGADRAFVAEYTVNAANTWEYKTITVSGGLITAGTWDWTNGIGLRVRWALAAGSTFQTTAGAWQTGNFLATANQVNCMDTIGNIFAITGVQLEVGSVATPFEHRHIGAELALCMRYYEKSYNRDVAPGTVTLAGAAVTRRAQAEGTTQFNQSFSVTKRATPTVTWFNPVTGTAGELRDISASSNIAVTGTFADVPVSETKTGAPAHSVIGAAGNIVTGHWTASAEL